MSRAAAKRATPIPSFVAPALATLAREPPGGELWIHEIKFDGYRMQIRIERGSVRLLTRTGLDWTGRFGAIARAFASLDVTSALIDGEAVVLDPRGASSFVKLVEALKAGRSADMVYFAFDLLFVDGADLRPLPLIERKRRLESLLEPAPGAAQLRYSSHLTGPGGPVLSEVCRLGLEGIVSKRADKPYASGRRGDWVKVKCLKSDELVVVGYLDSTAAGQSVGSLVLGYYDGKRLIYAGRVGTGFSQRSAHELWRVLQTLRIAKSPFAKSLERAQAKGVVWVDPQIVAQIEYRGWTADGLLRHASFKALRDDKPARTVGRPDMT